MDKKKIIIGVVILLVILIAGGFLLESNSEKTIVGSTSQITLPSNYELNGDSSGSVAHANNTYVTLIDVMTDVSFESDFDIDFDLDISSSVFIFSSFDFSFISFCLFKLFLILLIFSDKAEIE